MDRWPYRIETHTRKEISDAICDQLWQGLRIKMKAVPTTQKLNMLQAYRDNHTAYNGGPNGKGTFPVVDAEAQIRIDNYINALKRGGQLDENNCVQR